MGIPFNLAGWKDYWANRDRSHLDCNLVFNRLIYSGTDRTFNPAGFKQVLNDFDYMYSVYYAKQGAGDKGGHMIGVPGQEGYNVFQEVLLDACTTAESGGNQGACDLAAAHMCAQCGRDQILNNTGVLRLCGCEVATRIPSPIGNVTAECDPLCAQPSISKEREPLTGDVELCQAAVCVINNISITAARSTVSNISFSQVCPQCSDKNQCLCIMDASLPGIASAVGLSDPVAFRQVCGENSVCLTIDPQTQVRTEVPCENVLTPITPRTFSSAIPLWVWVVSILLLIVGLLVCLAAWYSGLHPTYGVISSTGTVTAVPTAV